MNWNSFFYGLDVGGCNVPGIYYAVSIWNVYVLPLAAGGLYNRFKEGLIGRLSLEETIMWLSILINTVAVYCISYDSIDNRAKLLMSISILFFATKGYQVGNKRIKGFKYIYNVIIFVFVGFMLLVNI